MAGNWRAIVASALDWEQAHATFDAAVKDLPAALRGRRPRNFPHSVWDIVEHIRLAQEDLLDFMTNPRYVAPAWPDDYWPKSPAPPTRTAWAKSLKAIRRDCRKLQKLTQKRSLDLTRRIPWGQGQTYLRTILVVLDHTSYHTAQIVDVRRLHADWG